MSPGNMNEKVSSHPNPAGGPSWGPVLHVGLNLVILVLFCAALWLLQSCLKNYRLQDIQAEIKKLPVSHLMLALLMTGLNYLVLTGLDALALKYSGSNLEYSRTAFTSFIGYAFSHNVGLSWLSGGSVRYRLYSAWGLSPVEIAKVVAFCTVSVTLGFFTVAGAAFVVEPLTIPSAIHFPVSNMHVLGYALLVPAVGYSIVTLTAKTNLRLYRLEIAVPPKRLVFPQIAIGSLDWILAGLAAYVLLPQEASLSFPMFLSIFLFSIIAGVISQVPGGLGVFESLMLLFLSPALAADAIMGSLVAFRILYYIIPLVAALLLFTGHEMLRKKQQLAKVFLFSQRWLTIVTPHFMAVVVFIGGVVLLVSGTTPSVESRLSFVTRILPLPVVEVSHFTGSLLGVALLVLAWGLSRRIDAAYQLTAVFLGLGAIVSLLKGFDYEEAIVLILMLAALLPCRRHFYRKAPLFSRHLTLTWGLAILLAVVGSVWLGVFSHKHAEYSHDLWWHFTLKGDASRFMRGSVGAFAMVIALAFFRLLRPVPVKAGPPDEATLEEIWPIVEKCPRTSANLALLGDKMLMLNEARNAFIMYDVEDRSWVAMGDPVGPEEEARELVWNFRELCDCYDGFPVFYQVSPENLHLYLDLGLSLLKLGEEARVNLGAFELEGSAMRAFRHTVNKVEREGYRFEIVPRDRVPSLMGAFQGISDAWLKSKETREKGFSLAFFKPDYVRRFPMAVVMKEDEVLAFANLLQGGAKEELSIDLMRYNPGSPNGIMDYLFVHLMLWGKREGFQWFNLGMAPLSGLEDRSLAPLWNRVGGLVFRHGEHFYNFEGLRNYKAKFDPDWTPKYLACPGGIAIPRVVVNIATLISRGFAGLFTK